MKDLNKENWLQIDPIIASGIFVWMSLADGSVESITADDWVARLVSINLSSKVPEEARTLFAVARGAMVYGGLFIRCSRWGWSKFCELRKQKCARRQARWVLATKGTSSQFSRNCGRKAS